MKPYKTTVPVLIIFFNRPETLKEVFASVKDARPSILFLAQDGARTARPDDVPLVEECRKIVEEIDWECSVYRNYSDANLSCDHREFTAITWAFKHTDRLMILEDDCVPCQSFYPFCEELLEKYKDDSRVDRICGYNRLEKYEDISSDYFFSTISSGFGWATWKRCWEEIIASSDFSFLKDEELCRIYEASRTTIADRNYGDMIELCRHCEEEDRKHGIITSWETLVGVYSILNHKLILTPRFNMVRNIGAVAGSTHYTEPRFLNRTVQKLLSMDSYDVSLPLKHPSHVIRDVNYEKKHYKFIHKNPLQKFFQKADVGLRRLFYGDMKGIKKAFQRRFK